MQKTDSDLLRQATEEADLANRLRNRDRQAVGELYDRYRRVVFVVIYRIVGNQTAAEDLVQETFLRVWNSFHTFDRERGDLGRWIASVARNRALDYVRSVEGRVARGTLPIQDWAPQAISSDFENDMTNCCLVQSLRAALGRLTPRQRTLLDLAYVNGLTHSELAERLERPLGTIKTWLRGAVQALRAEMHVEA